MHETLWAVYECSDGRLVVWPLRQCAGGEYTPCPAADMPRLQRLPLSVHSCRNAANRAIRAIILTRYRCAGSA